MQEEQNLFSTSSNEPTICKKLVVSQQPTPQFGSLIRSPFLLKSNTPLRSKFNDNIFNTPSTNENDVFRQQLADKILMRNVERTPSPKSRKGSSQKDSTNQKLSSTPKKSKHSYETPHKKSVQKSLFTNPFKIEEEEESRYEKEFTQLGIIGSGHFGKVYKCRNNFDNQVYAIKCTKINKYKKYSDAEEAINETQALAYLTAKGECKHIIRYYTAWKERSHCYILMEYCDFNVSNLAKQKRMNQQAFDEPELKHILKDITNGLKHLHDQQITHLDVKPDNILFNQKDGHYKIADLGLSRKSQLLKEEDINEGDARYLAPEILKESQNSDLTKADIFSLGISIYELILGNPLPVNGEQWHKIRNGLTINDFGPQTNQYSTKLKQLLINMMNPNSQIRFSAKEVLESDYIRIKKENLIKWERIRGVILRRQLDDMMHRRQLREHSM